MSYNGWTNYETWVVNLWMTNDEGSYNYWVESADQMNATELAEAMQDEHENSKPEVEGAFADLLNAALERVDWHEIAESFKESN